MAKMIIDIPDAVIDDIKATYEGLDVVYDAVKFGKVLPYRATNGDAIKALFPDSELHKESDYAYLTISKGVYLEDRDGTWWNAPYKAGDTDGNS